MSRRAPGRAALIASSYGIVVALVPEKWAPQDAFVSILGAVLVGMFLSWLVSLAAPVQFRRRATREQVAALPIRSPFGIWGSVAGFVMILGAIFESGLNSHLTAISGAVYLVVLTVAYVAIKASRKPEAVSASATQQS